MLAQIIPKYKLSLLLPLTFLDNVFYILHKASSNTIINSLDFTVILHNFYYPGLFYFADLVSKRVHKFQKLEH